MNRNAYRKIRPMEIRTRQEIAYDKLDNYGPITISSVVRAAAYDDQSNPIGINYTFTPSRPIFEGEAVRMYITQNLLQGRVYRGLPDVAYAHEVEAPELSNGTCTVLVPITVTNKYCCVYIYRKDTGEVLATSWNQIREMPLIVDVSVSASSEFVVELSRCMYVDETVLITAGDTAPEIGKKMTGEYTELSDEYLSSSYPIAKYQYYLDDDSGKPPVTKNQYRYIAVLDANGIVLDATRTKVSA